MLILSRKSGQTFHIGEDIHITITEVSGDKVKIGIEAPRQMSVLRDELVQVKTSNLEAVAAADKTALRSLAANLKQKEKNKTPNP
ncbi:MAG: carbon storage regulator [Oscillospiraceae bacterium]|nr:carbon storage regulator [Oscillospiraceae bacterium]